MEKGHWRQIGVKDYQGRDVYFSCGCPIRSRDRNNEAESIWGNQAQQTDFTQAICRVNKSQKKT